MILEVYTVFGVIELQLLSVQHKVLQKTALLCRQIEKLFVTYWHIGCPKATKYAMLVEAKKKSKVGTISVLILCFWKILIP
jgi:hypothetical protein